MTGLTNTILMDSVYTLNYMISTIKRINPKIIFTLLKYDIYNLFNSVIRHTVNGTFIHDPSFYYERFFIAGCYDSNDDIGHILNSNYKILNTKETSKLPAVWFYDCILLPHIESTFADDLIADGLLILSMYFNYIDCKMFYERRSVTLTC